MKKYNMIIIICFLIITFSLSNVYASINGLILLEKTIYIDPGHGGRDSGAVYKNIYEKDINLEISKKLEKELVSYGAAVYMTRDDDIDLSIGDSNKKRSDLANRAYKINKTRPDIYISIHQNYISSPKWKGLQIFYDSINPKNKLLAESLTNSLKEKLTNVREVKNNNSYYMYHRIQSPGVLIETGFLSNYEDRNNLINNNYQEELAKNIAISIIEYFNNNT